MRRTNMTKRSTLLLIIFVLAAATLSGCSAAFKLPTFLASWRPTTTTTTPQTPQQQQLQQLQDPLMTSASVFEPEQATRQQQQHQGKLAAALTRTHHHHLPLHLFRSLPKSIFGRFLATTPASTTSTTTATEMPMLVDWSALNGNSNNFMMQQQPQPQPQQHQAFSQVYHFQATQPVLQANHFGISHEPDNRGVALLNQQVGVAPRPEKHALGFGDNGEDFVTIMSAEPQPHSSDQAATEVATKVNDDVEQQHERNKEKPAAAAANSSQVGDTVSQPITGGDQKQQANETTARAANATLLTNLIGEELTRLKHEPEDLLNSTLNSMGQPLLTLLMEQQAGESKDNSSSSQVDAQQQHPAESPESGRSESAASAVIVGPPSSPGSSSASVDEVDNFAADAADNSHELAAALANDETNAIVAAAALEEQQQQVDSGFILGPYKGLTSDSIVRHSQQQQLQRQQPEFRQQKSVVGMSAMASNLIQQAKSLIQMPFTTSAGQQQQQLGSGAMVHTQPNNPSGGSRLTSLFRGQQQSNYASPLRQSPLAAGAQEQLMEQATSPAPFSFAPAMSSSGYNNNNYQQQQPAFHRQQRPPAWQQQQQQQQHLNFPPMMMPNNQQRSRPKNPFGFNRYFLMPATTAQSQQQQQHLGHLQQQQFHYQQPQHHFGGQQSGAKNVPYFVEQPPPQLMNHVNGQQRPQAGESGDSSQATGFQLAVDHSAPAASQESVEQARKKFKSGLYQIEPPRLAPSQVEQLRVASTGKGGDDTEQLQQTKEEQDSDNSEQQSESSDDAADDSAEQLQQASSTGSSTERPQQQQEQFAAKQVGASIGFSTTPGANSTTAKTHKGKVFNEPIADLMARPKPVGGKPDETSDAPETDGGRSLSHTKQLKHTEQVTLYEFESPAQQPTPALAPARGAAPQRSQQQLLDTQVFTIPYTINAQPNGQVSHFVAPSTRTNQQQQPLRYHQQNSMPRDPPFAHSFISSTWAAPAQAAHRYFNQAQQPAIRLPQPQYLAPPGIERQRTQPQLFKNVFEEAQQMSAASLTKPQQQQRPLAHNWANQQLPMRPVSTLAFAPEQPQHYFHYQPLQTNLRSQTQQQQQPQQQQPQQQVVFELANEARQAAPAQQQQFAMAIDHSSGQNVGSSIFTSNQQTLPPPVAVEREPAAAPVAKSEQPTTTTQAPPAAPVSSEQSGSEPTPIQSREQREDRANAAPSLPTALRENDDDEGSEKLANLRAPQRAEPEQQRQQAPLSATGSSPSAFCANRAPGLYADESQRCTAYYQCAPSGHQMFRCNNETYFNQKTQNCDWWHNVNCGGQNQADSSEQLPQSEPLQRQSAAAAADDEARNNSPSSEPQSASGSTSTQEQDGQQQASSGERFHHSADGEGADATSAPSTTAASTTIALQQTQQQPAPTSSTPIYGLQSASDLQQQFMTDANNQQEFSARSTTTQDPLLLEPSSTVATFTTTTTPSTTTTTTTAPPTTTTTDISNNQEAQPQVGSQLGEQAQLQSEPTFSSSTSISSADGSAQEPSADQVTSVATPIRSDSRPAAKLSARSVAGRLSTSAVLVAATRQRQQQQQEESSIYSTSANQGSVSYTPMDTHQLTARAFQSAGSEQQQQAAPPSSARPAAAVEKRFGARLQQTTTTTSLPTITTSHRQRTST